MSFGTLCAVVVSHNPPPDFAENIPALLPQVHHAVIVDNGSGPETQAMLSRFVKKSGGKLDLILNAENRGLATAQNQGIVRARKRNADWILLLDDDSRPASDMVERLQEAFLNHSAKDKIALIAPAIHDENTGDVSRYVLPLGPFFTRRGFGKNATLEPCAAIASGSLIRTALFRKLGLFREEFFIDYVDTEFCLRLISRGWKILAVRDATLHHRLGDKTRHSLAGITVVASNHSPERRFTIYRNRVAVWKAYGLKTPGYVGYDMLAAAWDLLRILALEQQKSAKLQAALRGLVAGVAFSAPTTHQTQSPPS